MTEEPIHPYITAYNNGGTLKSVGKQFRVGYQRVRAVLVEHNVPLRDPAKRRIPPIPPGMATDYTDKGMTLYQLATKYNTSYYGAQVMLTRAGVQLREPARQKQLPAEERRDKRGAKYSSPEIREFAADLRTLAQHHGYANISDVAKAHRHIVSQTAMYSLLTGRNRPMWNTLDLILREFGVDPQTWRARWEGLALPRAQADE